MPGLMDGGDKRFELDNAKDFISDWQNCLVFYREGVTVGALDALGHPIGSASSVIGSTKVGLAQIARDGTFKEHGVLNTSTHKAISLSNLAIQNGDIAVDRAGNQYAVVSINRPRMVTYLDLKVFAGRRARED